MATISKEGDGRRRIQFFDRDGKRRSIGLGKVPQRIAESWRSHVTLLNQAVTHGQPVPDETIAWLAKLGDRQAAKLAKVSLIPTRQRALLGSFIDQYIAGRKDVKSGTLVVLGRTRRNLVEYFGTSKPLRDISPGDADDWHRWLVTDERLSDNTARRRCGIAKQFFRAAQRKRLIQENPFADLQSSVRGNRLRDFFVSREIADKVLAACPSLQWQLIFVLSRYGALRCPSEHLALNWGDIDFDRGRMYVRSSKTERHDGGEGRWVPIFIELRPYLDRAFAETEGREDWSLRPDRPMSMEPVLSVPSGPKVNWRTQLERIIRAAGLEPWPKLFQNMRATRATELADQYPGHVAAAWCGHSETIADEHYRRPTEEHFQRATAEPVTGTKKTVQKTVQHTAAGTRGDEQQERAALSNPLENAGNPRETALVQNCQVGPV